MLSELLLEMLSEVLAENIDIFNCVKGVENNKRDGWGCGGQGMKHTTPPTTPGHLKLLLAAAFNEIFAIFMIERC